MPSKINNQKILRRIEETYYALFVDQLPGGLLKPLKVEGVKGRISTINNPFLNCVGLADVDEAKCQSMISSVIEIYEKEKKGFQWLVGPTTRPKNMDKYLTESGFKRIDEESAFGMVLKDIDIAIDTNEDFKIREVEVGDFEENTSLITKSFGMGLTDEIARIIIDLYASQGKNSHLYLAFTGENKPVAFSASVIDPENHLVILLGAGTLPEYRGKGIYSSFVDRRLKDAGKAGANVAIIQALKNTSAPICRRLGFEAVCQLDSYLYSA